MSTKTISEEDSQNVSPRQWIRSIAAYLLIPVILLICGGEFGWWQAWLYSLLIVAAGIGGRMWAEHRHPGLMAERQNIENIRNARGVQKSVSVKPELIEFSSKKDELTWQTTKNLTYRQR